MTLSPQLWKLLQFVSFKAFSFWLCINIVTDALLVCYCLSYANGIIRWVFQATAFTLRLSGMGAHGDHQLLLRLRSFQVLSYVSPLIWMSESCYYSLSRHDGV